MLDIEQPDQLLQYLRATKRIAPDESPAIRVLAGGVSNRTVLVERPGGESWVMKQALEKLRVKADWFSSPLRIHREAQGLRHLEKLAPPGTITPLIFEDHEHHLLAMQAVPQPHENWKTLLLAGDVRSDHVRQFAELLGTIHRRGYEQRETVAKEFEDRSFFETLRLEPYYEFASQHVPDATEFLHALVRDTREARFTIVHGDYSPKNVLIHKGKLVLLDHEVIHFGDGAFDVGFALTHLLSKAHHLPAHREDFLNAAREFWRVYDRLMSPLPCYAGLEERSVKHTLACLLARVAGRSPLEYLNEAERRTQQRTMLALSTKFIPRINDMITAFAYALS